MASSELVLASTSHPRELIAKREVFPVALVRLYLDRIARLDPQLHAFITVDEQGALTAAKAAE